MRRTYISPEYINNKINGTYNTHEESALYGSKMMKLEDDISIMNTNLSYFQQSSGEQINLLNEQNISNIIFSSSVEKKKNHNLSIDESQSNYQKENKTLWSLTIDIKTILKDYLYASIKKSRAFEGFKNIYSLTNNVDNDIYNYIDYNLMDRYKYSKFEMFINYTKIENSTSLLRYTNTWKILSKNNKKDNFNISQAIDGSSLSVSFTQDYSSQNYNFDYFFNVYYHKI